MKKLILSLTLLALPATSATHAASLDDGYDAFILAPTRAALLGTALATGAIGAFAHFGPHRHYKKQYANLYNALDTAGRARLRKRIKAWAVARNVFLTLAGLSGTGYGVMKHARIKHKSDVAREKQLEEEFENMLEPMRPKMLDTLYKHAGLVPTKDGLIYVENRRNLPLKRVAYYSLTGPEADQIKEQLLNEHKANKFTTNIGPSRIARTPVINRIALALYPPALFSTTKDEINTSAFEKQAKELRKQAKAQLETSHATALTGMNKKKLAEQAVVATRYNRGPLITFE